MVAPDNIHPHPRPWDLQIFLLGNGIFADVIKFRILKFIRLLYLSELSRKTEPVGYVCVSKERDLF